MGPALSSWPVEGPSAPSGRRSALAPGGHGAPSAGWWSGRGSRGSGVAAVCGFTVSQEDCRDARGAGVQRPGGARRSSAAPAAVAVCAPPPEGLLRPLQQGAADAGRGADETRRDWASLPSRPLQPPGARSSPQVGSSLLPPARFVSLLPPPQQVGLDSAPSAPCVLRQLTDSSRRVRRVESSLPEAREVPGAASSAAGAGLGLHPTPRPAHPGPGSQRRCCAARPAPPPPGSPLSLPPRGCPTVEVSPVALSQGTIHPGGLLIKTMCGVAGQGGGSSGSQAWPGACGLREGCGL